MRETLDELIENKYDGVIAFFSKMLFSNEKHCTAIDR